MSTHSNTAGHRRTRRDHATETAEDYVEAIADLIAEHGRARVTDLARLFHVSHVTVTRTVQRLERDGFVQTKPHRPVELTQRGRDLAQKCRRRHEIVYRFLLAIGVSEKTAAIDSEGIEHHVSPETLERLRAIAEDEAPPTR